MNEKQETSAAIASFQIEPKSDLKEVESVGGLARFTTGVAGSVADNVVNYAQNNRPTMFLIRSILFLVGGSALVATLWETAFDPRFLFGVSLLGMSYGIYKIAKPKQ